MAKQIDIEQNASHVWDNFEWEREPECSCGRLIQAVKEKFVFVSNIVDGESPNEINQFYMMPVNANGFLTRRHGVGISYCPWCGDKIVGRKRKRS